MTEKLMTYEQVISIQKLLKNNLFDSKDWKSGNLANRVEWLLTMVESLNEQLNEQLDNQDQLRKQIEDQLRKQIEDQLRKQLFKQLRNNLGATL